MKLGLLELICTHFNSFDNVMYIKRVDNNVLKIAFDKENVYYFDLTKGNSAIYKKDGFENTKDYNAPFDILLSKRFSNAQITKIWLHNQDKILRLQVSASSSYKKLNTILQLEFTGKYTNAIIIDENEIILEAMRHISENISSRIVKVGEKLTQIEKKEFTPKPFELQGSLEEHLIEIYQQTVQNKLSKIKENKINHLTKQLKEHQKLLDDIESKDALLEASNKAYGMGDLLLANRHLIKSYQENIKLLDFEGKTIDIALDRAKTIQNHIDTLYNQAKKYKQKALGCHIEQQNLEAKISHLRTMLRIVEHISSIDELEFYYPKKEKNQKITKKIEPYQSFFIGGYKILVGRNAKENEWLLKNAKASDFWFHLKDRPSSHVFVGCTKKELPQKVIVQAAIICAQFSCEFGGGYEVDYTQRRHLKIQNGSNVTYTEYKTIFVKI